MALLRSFGSRQILKEPSFFGTMTIELIHDVGSCTGETIPCCVRSESVFWSNSRRATGTRRSACWTGRIVLSTLDVVLTFQAAHTTAKDCGVHLPNRQVPHLFVADLVGHCRGIYDMIIILIHGFLPSSGRMSGLSTSLQSSWQWDSPCQTPSHTSPTTGSLVPP